MRERVELECPFCAIVLNKLSTYQLHMSISHRGKAWDKDGLCSAVLKVSKLELFKIYIIFAYLGNLDKMLSHYGRYTGRSINLYRLNV